MKLNPLFLVVLAGCVDDPTLPDDSELGETAQQVTSTTLNTFTCTTSSPPCNFNLGTATNRACFISGIRGGVSFSSINSNGTDFILTVYRPLGGTPATAITTCVTPASNVTNTYWNTNIAPSIQIAGTTASTRCFLAHVAASGGGLTNYNDSIRTWRDSAGHWFIGGSKQVGYLSARAICFDGAISIGEWGWGQGVPGSITGNLASNSAGGVACGLTEIGGMFGINNATNDGVFIDYLSGSQQWIWTLKNYKHGAADCIK